MKRLAVCDRLVAIATMEGTLGKFLPIWGKKKTKGRLEKKLGRSSRTNNNIYMPHFILSMKKKKAGLKDTKCALQKCSDSISAVSFTILIFNIVNDIHL